MLSMTGAELKCTMAIARETFGWHRDRQEISLSRLMELTGLSRQGVINGIEEGMKRGIIDRANEGQGYSYSLSVEAELVKNVDQLESDATSQESRPALVNKVDGQKSIPVKNVDQPSPKSRREVVKKLDQPIKEDKEIKETLKETEAAAPPANAKRDKSTIPVVEPWARPYEQIFRKYYRAVYPAEYQDTKGDYCQLAYTRRQQKESLNEESWDTAARNYLDSELGNHTMADLARRYPAFLKGPLNQYGNRSSGNGSQRVVGEATPKPGKYSSHGVRPDVGKT
jgi:phage replication O-like protein O